MNNVFSYLFIIISFQLFAGERHTPKEYLDKYKNATVGEIYAFLYDDYARME